jgi:hypothetical protein
MVRNVSFAVSVNKFVSFLTDKIKLDCCICSVHSRDDITGET